MGHVWFLSSTSAINYERITTFSSRVVDPSLMKLRQTTVVSYSYRELTHKLLNKKETPKLILNRGHFVQSLAPACLAWNPRHWHDSRVQEPRHFKDELEIARRLNHPCPEASGWRGASELETLRQAEGVFCHGREPQPPPPPPRNKEATTTAGETGVCACTRPSFPDLGVDTLLTPTRGYLVSLALSEPFRSAGGLEEFEAECRMLLSSTAPYIPPIW